MKDLNSYAVSLALSYKSDFFHILNFKISGSMTVIVQSDKEVTIEGLEDEFLKANSMGFYDLSIISFKKI